LQRIVSKALAKNREERYQTSKDLLIDLRRVKQRLEFEAELARSVGPEDEPQTVVTVRLSPESETAGKSPFPTGEGGEERPTAGAEYLVSPVKHHRRSLVLALTLVVIAVAGIIYFVFGNKLSGGGHQAIDSIAVLPFVNTSADAENEYLSDGITETLINSLSQLPHLRVMSRNSVFRFKGPETDAKAAGKALGVSAVLTGRVTQHGQDLIISAELIDARDNSNLWGEQYSRRLSDLLTVQADIAKEISGTLRLKLSGAEQSRVTKSYTKNAEAYQLYLKGRYFWLKFTPADHQRAAEYFNQAIAKDPAYALAYTGLADTYGASATNGWIAPTEAYPKAKAAAKKALALDETLAEAHATSGALTMFYDLDWATAEREYKRAIELNPNYAITYELYSYLLCATGQLDEGIKTAQRGLEVDPLSVPLSDDTGQAYYLARRYDEALKQFQKSTEMDPNDAAANIYSGAVYEQKARYDEAVAAFQKAIKVSERTSNILGFLGHAYAASGKRAEALKILEELKEMSRQKYVSSYDLAVLYIGLGEKERAIEQLNKAYEDRAGWIINLKVEPLFDPLRLDRRFADLLRRMGL
jgi:TolB-like protein/Tfp pilus assembly protein PilF